MTTHCYAAYAAKEALKPFDYEPKPLEGSQVEVEITHCGVCHSDLHLVDNEWGISKYPLVPGHEIVGFVKEVGNEIHHLKPGDRVGIGWQCNSCGTCEWCMRGEEHQCPQMQATCVGHYGGFANSIRVNGRFAFPIPEELTSELAAPLFCGGITVFSPLRQHIIHPNMQVAIVGIGGLGHLALQFARAFGCEVTALSSTPDKAKEAVQLGAHHFAVITDKAQMQTLKNSFDFILSTAAGGVDCKALLACLRPYGKLCVVGGPTIQINIPFLPLIEANKSISGSHIGGCPEIMEMLAIAAKHHVHPKIEMVKMKDVNHALDKLRKNEARYRMVLENE